MCLCETWLFHQCIIFIGSGFIAPATLFLFSINEQVLQVHCGHETMIVYLVQQFLYEDVESSTSYMLFKQLHGEKSTKPLQFVFIPYTTLWHRGYKFVYNRMLVTPKTMNGLGCKLVKI